MLKKCYVTVFLLIILFVNSICYSGNNFSHLDQIPDEREWLVSSYLPKLAGSVLYIGVGSYTTEYYLKTQNPELFETIDFLEERAVYGCPYKHYVKDFMLLDPATKYDHVSFFGILGYHVKKFAPFDTKKSIAESLHHVDDLVKVGGTLQVAANYGLTTEWDLSYWEEPFNDPIFDKYEVLTFGISQYNVIWWGKKIKN